MKRKLLTLVLALSVLGGAAAPAVSALGADQRLSAVTAKVKAALALDTAAYPEFYGELDEAVLAPTWQLEWNGPDGHISVSATEDGKVLRYYSSADQDAVSPGYSEAPAFPSGDRNSARAAAEAFVKKLLSTGETVSFRDQGRDRLGTSSYRFYGEILVNGLSAGLSCNVSVRCADNKVVSFDRDSLEGSVMGGIPSATAQVGQDAAGKTLRDARKLRLEYELKDPNGRQAVLRYLPEATDEYYVDAASGKLVNLTDAYKDVDEDGGAMFNTSASEPAAAAEATADRAGGLTAAEQAGAVKLEGVLDRDTLDKKARDIKALCLEPYKLSTANYTVSREEDGKVSAILRYGRQVEGSSWRRTVTLDARTGELESVSSSGWLPENAAATRLSNAAARQKAEAFLTSQCPDLFTDTVLYDGTGTTVETRQPFHTFQYAQKANDIFFPANSLYVGVDSTDGSISSYRKEHTEGVTFDSPAGILTADQALDAWLATYEVKLQYVPVPTAVDYSKPEFEKLASFGVRYMHTLALGYKLYRENDFTGIDAKTGEPVIPDWSSDDGTLRYDDVAGHWAASEINGLARYGVGYQGGRFEPNKQLTQADLIVLILSCDGWRFDPQEEGALDRLYDRAYSKGLLKRGERNETQSLTRSAAVRMLLDGWGYGAVAKLNGIYKTSYTDDASIPAAGYGYAALAQGLGLVSGPAYEPQGGMTRAQAAVMLYRLLGR